MIEEIRKSIHQAAADRKKSSMFHFQVLKHAFELQHMDPREFCQEVRVPETYQAEFRKMISLAKLMRERGITLKGPECGN